jgi:small nuclear ribonucleoprotein D2
MPVVATTQVPDKKYHKLVNLDRDDVKIKKEALDDEPIKAEDLTEEDIALQEAQREAYEFEHGPFSLLHHAVRDKTRVVVWIRSDHKLVAGIKAFDRHGNMVLTNVKEIWYEVPKKKKGKKKRRIERNKFMHLVFLRGDNVITVVNASDHETSAPQKSPQK